MVVCGEYEDVLGLPVAGIISDKPCEVIGPQYERIDNKVKAMGSKLRAPYMTMSFMALLVIPDMKMSDLGLFDGKSWKIVDVILKEGEEC